jgi:hypothetical protein
LVAASESAASHLLNASRRCHLPRPWDLARDDFKLTLSGRSLPASALGLTIRSTADARDSLAKHLVFRRNLGQRVTTPATPDGQHHHARQRGNENPVFATHVKNLPERPTNVTMEHMQWRLGIAKLDVRP